MKHFDRDDLTGFVAALFGAAGCNAAEARLVALGLVEANAMGHDSHGVLRVPIYLAHLDAGIVVAGVTPEVISDAPGFLLLDGKQGLGQSACEIVVAEGIARARASGCATVAIRNVGHVGRLGRWAEQAAAAGIVSLHVVNTSGGAEAEVILAAPYGGRDRRMSINPLCIGFPGPDGPLIMDATIAATAGGKVLAALNRGDTLPEGQIIDRHGNPSTVPQDLFDGGAVLPFGDHRGYALAFMIDLLAGALSGGGCSSQPRHSKMNNMTSIFLDPARGAAQSWASDVAAYAAWMKAAPPLRDGGEVLVPGEVEARTARQRGVEGLPLDAVTCAALVACAQKLGVLPIASLAAG